MEKKSCQWFNCKEDNGIAIIIGYEKNPESSWAGIPFLARPLIEMRRNRRENLSCNETGGGKGGFELDVLNRKSGRRDSNSRMVAWEATALPLGYARSLTGIYFTAYR